MRISKTPKRDFLTVADLHADEIIAVLDHATAMKNQRATGGRRKSLEGRSVALIFEKASTRTRLSFEVGVFEAAHVVGRVVEKARRRSQQRQLVEKARTLY